MTYFHMRMHTIIGAESFHCPVRDGKEWGQLAIVVRHNCCRDQDGIRMISKAATGRRIWKKQRIGVVDCNASGLGFNLRSSLVMLLNIIGSSLTGN